MITSIVDIIDGRFFVGFWFVHGAGVDWFATAWRDGDGPYEAMYRFRYYAPKGEPDRKSVFRMKANGVGPQYEAQIVTMLHAAAEMMGKAMGSKPVFVEVRSDNAETVARAIAAQSFTHLSRVGMTSPGGNA